MGNNHSSASRASTVSPPPSGAPHSAQHAQQHHPHRRDARNILPVHSTQRSVAPPEASLAQAHGSTSVGRPKSLPSTAVSSLSASPLSNVSTPTKPPDSRTAHRQEPTKPVDVPVESSSLRPVPIHPHHPPQPRHLPYEHTVSNSSLADMYLRGPPRLPLPIEEEVHTPGSPILAPDESFGPIDLGESSDGLTRKSSGVSANTLDDEESEELRVDKTRPLVPVRLEWNSGGEKVYVTGTIFQWNRKHRLHPVQGKPGCLAATIHILPGTHHIRFLVDGIMQTSTDLPTTVDFGNNLVNYIEVSPDDVPQKQRHGNLSKFDNEGEGMSRTSSQVKDQPRPPKGRHVEPLERYCSQVPQYLLDFDQSEESIAYRNAVGAMEKLPTPPSLPGFLAKPILNAATLMKDDNSVLNMPNHTVLNHLATSSIKNNILAVSATTRYRNKYVTTIMYKPASADEG